VKGWNCVLSVWEDLAVREMAAKKRDDLLQEQKMEALGTLAGGIAHDFNNILTPIVLGVELADIEAENPVEARKHLVEVRNASKRAAALVQQILNFSRKQKSERKLIRLQLAVAEAVRLVRSSLPTTIDIDASLDPLTPVVRADANQIQQIVTNLCSNAAHAMRHRPGRLTIRLKSLELDEAALQELPPLSPGAYACLTIDDSGHGMDAETLTHIFEPFFTTKPPGEGTGLGLAIVYDIVKEHEGVITVRSQTGTGTSIAIYFPQQTLAPDLPVDVAENTVYVPRGERLLFVDDEPSIRAAVGGYLERIGYKVTALGDPHEALKVFRNAPDNFDVVITDLTMPGLTGIDLAREILALRPTLPVMLVSGAIRGDVEKAAHAVGIRRILPKPLDPALLMQAIGQPHPSGRGTQAPNVPWPGGAPPGQ
jgi:nitrogen-specific signal transduction histidine kinase/ActR/RegA family two-component response regulator